MKLRLALFGVVGSILLIVVLSVGASIDLARLRHRPTAKDPGTVWLKLVPTPAPSASSDAGRPHSAIESKPAAVAAVPARSAGPLSLPHPPAAEPIRSDDPVPSGSSVAPKPLPTSLLAYALRVQDAVQRAVASDGGLVRGGATSPGGGGDVTLSLWIDPSGHVARSETRLDSGPPELKSALDRVRTRIVLLPAPPADLPQPVDIQFSDAALGFRSATKP